MLRLAVPVRLDAAQSDWPRDGLVLRHASDDGMARPECTAYACPREDGISAARQDLNDSTYYKKDYPSV